MNKVRVHGEVTLPFADDRGSYDNWLIGAIKDAIEAGPELDDIYDKLGLKWELVNG